MDGVLKAVFREGGLLNFVGESLAPASHHEDSIAAWPRQHLNGVASQGGMTEPGLRFNYEFENSLNRIYGFTLISTIHIRVRTRHKFALPPNPIRPAVCFRGMSGAQFLALYWNWYILESLKQRRNKEL